MAIGYGSIILDQFGRSARPERVPLYAAQLLPDRQRIALRDPATAGWFNGSIYAADGKTILNAGPVVKFTRYEHLP